MNTLVIMYKGTEEIVRFKAKKNITEVDDLLSKLILSKKGSVAFPLEEGGYIRIPREVVIESFIVIRTLDD